MSASSMPKQSYFLNMCYYTVTGYRNVFSKIYCAALPNYSLKLLISPNKVFLESILFHYYRETHINKINITNLI